MKLTYLSFKIISSKKNVIKTTKQKEKFKARDKKSKGKGKCFFCGKKMPLEKGVPRFLKKKQGMQHSLLVESRLVANSTNS